MLVDGQAIPMDVYPEIVNGRLCLPLRYVAKAFGKQINWDQESRSVFVALDEYLDQALKDIQNKLYNNAEDKCNKLLDLSPNDPMAYFMKGEAQYLDTKFEDAVTSCGKAIEVKPKFPDAYMLRANAYYKIYSLKGGSRDNLISDASKAIELSDTPAVYYTQRASLYNRLKDYSKAIDDCNKAIELNPKYIEAYRQRAISYFFKEGREEFRSELSKLLEIDPENKWAKEGIRWLDSKENFYISLE